MRLLHYSATRLGPIVDASEQQIHFKPNGLWVSVEGPGDWPSWCEWAQWGLDRLQYTHEVALQPGAAILFLTTAEAIDEFTLKYPGRPPFPFSYPTTGYIDWPTVSELYDGIIIAPYIHSRWIYGSCDWYYSWDCASGCIWRARAIERVTLLDCAETEAAARSAAISTGGK